jgi:hypothetical protein
MKPLGWVGFSSEFCKIVKEEFTVLLNLWIEEKAFTNSFYEDRITLTLKPDRTS